MKASRLFAFATSLAVGSAASAQAVLSEVFVNPPGSDNGFESVEITGQPGLSLAGWHFIVIEGGAVSSGAVGTVDVSLDLSALTLGSNGVGLVRDAGTFFNPLPEPGTNTIVFDFNPDIENGSNTYILGFGAAPSVGTDLDVDNDGFLDPGALSGFTVVDAVAYLEAVTEFQYAGQLGGTDLGQLQAISGIGPFTPDALYRVLTPAACGPLAWAGGDVLSDPVTLADPFTWDFDRNFGFAGAGIPSPELMTLDIGSRNLFCSGMVPCYPDCDNSGSLDFFDFLCFQNEFSALTPYADCDNSGSHDFFDFLCFQNAFAAGCP